MALEKNAFLHNRYRVIEILGQGGMGSVYQAVDENLGVTVALKENLFTTDEYSRQFRLEAVILANLRHPNLPRVYDHFIFGEQQYLVMDYIEGEDLRQRMERLGNISEEDAVQIGASICDALTYLHTRKPPILHRDIKPGNVKITPEGHIFLVDFGLAKVYQDTTQATSTGARAMTPGYSPPEQYGTARTDPRTDIYSLGATLYASLSGIIPEDGLARAMDNAQLTPLRKRNTRTSRRMAAAIEKALAVDPSDRFQNAEDFKAALLNAKSRTQQIPGGYTVTPPPIHAEVLNDAGEDITEIEKTPRPKSATGPVHPTVEEQPFVSPLKKHKERERKRRFALIRFVFLLLILLLVSIPFFVPGVLPSNVRAAIPFLGFLNTTTPTPTITPFPSSTPTQTPTATLARPTATRKPASTATSTAADVPLSPLLTETITLTPTAVATPMGGGSGQVAYASDRSGSPQIYLASLTSDEIFQMTDIPEGACQPSWSPAGDRLVFVSPCDGSNEVYPESSLYLINSDGSNLVPLPTSPGGDFDPVWSPDGNTIAFTSLRSGQMEIFIFDLSAQSSVQITQGAPNVESHQAAWSPDGTQIAYTVKRLGVSQIWLMNMDGTNQQQIVRSGSSFSDYLPAWSQDGGSILFNQRCIVSFCPPYIIRVSATDRSNQQGTRLPFGSSAVEDVEFSLDGFWLVFEGQETGGNKDILYMTVSGASRTPLGSAGGVDFDPAWRPSP
jgi:serine/threonine protein kinase/Tol biopolymer transport system component